MSEPYGIALVGCGTVGSGVAQLLLEQQQRLAARAGRPLQLRHIVVRNPDRQRPVNLPGGLITSDFRRVLEDPSVHVVAELVGGTDFARRAVLESLTAGKHVVTANKALLATHGAEVFDCARRNGRAVAFEATVAGGVPIIAAISQSLAANQITGIQGILNGTSNFILTAMTEQGQGYAEVLAEAQRRGYAEADPTLDVDGTDAAQKLAILSQIAFGLTVPIASIPRQGITALHEMDIRVAAELGCVIKLLAEAWLTEGEVALHVSPVLLRKHTPLAQVRGAYNAIQVIGDAVGDTLYYGPGAGMMPTASSVVADLIDMAVGRAQLTFQTLRLWSGDVGGVLRLRVPSAVRSRYYLRQVVEDRPGVLAEVAAILARHDVSIASVIQHEAPEGHEGDAVQLVIMTHAAPTEQFRAAVEEIDRLSSVAGRSVFFPAAD